MRGLGTSHIRSADRGMVRCAPYPCQTMEGVSYLRNCIVVFIMVIIIMKEPYNSDGVVKNPIFTDFVTFTSATILARV